MKTYANTMTQASKRHLAALRGAQVNSWSATLPVGDHGPVRSWGFVKLDTSHGPVFLCLFEGTQFPDVAEMEILDSTEFKKRLEETSSPFQDGEWHPVPVGKTIREISVCTDTGTDVRGDEAGGVAVLDTCAIAFDLDDGSILLFEKTHTESEVWDISREPSGKTHLSARKPENLAWESVWEK